MAEGGKTEKDVHILNRVTPRPPVYGYKNSSPGRQTPPSQTITPSLSKSKSLSNKFLSLIHSPTPRPNATTVLPTPTFSLNLFTISAAFPFSTSPVLVPNPVTTTAFPPNRPTTTLPSMPAKHHGNCSTSASNACTVAFAYFLYSSSSSMLASR